MDTENNFDNLLDDALIKELRRRGYVVLPKGTSDGSSCFGKDCKVCHNKTDAIKFVSYDGKYPNLCSGTLVLGKDGKQYQLQHCLRSGGSVFFDSDWNGIVTSGSWNVVDLPEELEPFHDEIEQLVNDNVPQGCYGGCI